VTTLSLKYDYSCACLRHPAAGGVTGGCAPRGGGSGGRAAAGAQGETSPSKTKRVTESGATDVTNYYYQDGVVSFTTDASGNKTSFNIIGQSGNIIATKRYGGAYAGKLYVYGKDAQGSVTAVYGEGGEFVTGYAYDDFGQTEELTAAEDAEAGAADEDAASAPDPFYNEVCYTGGIYDKSTGLYYLNARYYDPAEGRFISADTYRGDVNDPSTLNLYAYCANNPINFVDPTGHSPLTGKGKTGSRKFKSKFGYRTTGSTKIKVTISWTWNLGVQVVRVDKVKVTVKKGLLIVFAKKSKKVVPKVYTRLANVRIAVGYNRMKFGWSKFSLANVTKSIADAALSTIDDLFVIDVLIWGAAYDQIDAVRINAKHYHPATDAKGYEWGKFFQPLLKWTRD
jgi:RHS repeat-associated protein